MKGKERTGKFDTNYLAGGGVVVIDQLVTQKGKQFPNGIETC